MKNPRWVLSPATFALAVITFFLPFVDISCGGQKVASFTGIQLVTGTNVQAPSLFGESQKEKVKPEPFAILALLCALLGLAFSFSQKGGSAVVRGIVAVIGVVAVFLLRMKLAGEITHQGEGAIVASFAVGFWLLLLLYLWGIVLNFFLLRQPKKEHVQSEVPNITQPPETS